MDYFNASEMLIIGLILGASLMAVAVLAWYDIKSGS